MLIKHILLLFKNQKPEKKSDQKSTESRIEMKIFQLEQTKTTTKKNMANPKRRQSMCYLILGPYGQPTNQQAK